MTTTTTQALDLDHLAELLRKPDGGFTVDAHTGEPLVHGYAVATYPEFSVDLPADQVNVDTLRRYLRQHAADLATAGTAFGGWHDPETSRVWLDVSTVTTWRARAEYLAKLHNQIAIFDLDRGESIPTGGTGSAS